MDWSSDSFLNGRLTVCQERNGYRFSLDAAILAFHAVPDQPAMRVLDLGTGCAIMPLIMACRHPGLTFIGVEIQAELAALARRNVVENGFTSRIAIIEGDFVQLQSQEIGAPVDMVITNPPYRKPGSGRVNPQNQKALARHEIAASLVGLVKSMRRFLTTGGCAWMVYPVERLAELMAAMQAYNMEPKHLRLIHSRAGSDAIRCIVKTVKAARPGLTVGPPLIIHSNDGQYTEEVSALLRP
jgi:tRNA1Val (adenine37-N6)-methyltransferase